MKVVYLDASDNVNWFSLHAVYLWEKGVWGRLKRLYCKSESKFLHNPNQKHKHHQQCLLMGDTLDS